jgi:hypothetical protein
VRQAECERKEAHFEDKVRTERDQGFTNHSETGTDGKPDLASGRVGGHPMQTAPTKYEPRAMEAGVRARLQNSPDPKFLLRGRGDGIGQASIGFGGQSSQRATRQSSRLARQETALP